MGICIYRSDNEAAVITPDEYRAQRQSLFESWAAENGIEIENSPSETHESNGRAERAGQEIINKSNAMLLDANLPGSLWPETTKAAALLHNLSPKEANGMKSPNEVLLKWFQDNLRWHNPTLLARASDDLRPDWSGIYAYGCRAYALNKEREAEKNSLFFRTHPRAHIGYLVGYRAANIYRIWVPELDKVITTRNVAFDEDIFYTPDHRPAEQELQLEAEALDLVVVSVDEIQDAGSVLGDLTSRDPEFDSFIYNENVNGSEEAQEEHQISIQETQGEHGPSIRLGTPVPEEAEMPLGQDSGVEAPGITAAKGGEDTSQSQSQTLGLLSPEATPEPGPPEALGHSGAAHNTATEGIMRPEILQGRGVHFNDPVEGSDSRLGVSQDEDSQSGIRETQQESQQQESGAQEPADELSRNTLPSLAPTTSLTRASIRQRGPPKFLIDELSQASTGRRSQKKSGTSSRGGRAASYNAAILEKETNLKMGWFFNTFMPGFSDEDNGGDYQTFHAVFAAAVMQKRAPRLAASPSRPRIHYSDLTKPPKKVSDLKGHLMEKQFWDAMHAEIRKLIDKGTWKEMDRDDARRRPLPLKWVFTYKFDADGYLTGCKARICVRGDLQPFDTLQNTYAATLTARSFRVAIAVMAQFDLECKQLDITNAFLNASLEELDQTIHCELPDGFKKDGKIVELEKALYGLRESPQLWFKEFSRTLKGLGLEPNPEDPCLWQDSEKRIMVLFYVDDILVLYNKKDERAGKRVIEGITTRYEARMEGDIEWFLGIRVKRDRSARKAWLIHDSYIEKTCKRYNLVNAATKFPQTPLPMSGLEKFLGTATRAQIKAFQEKVGSLIYTAVMIRCDVAFAAAILSQHLLNPSPAHLAAVDQVHRYLYGTRYLGLGFGGEHREAVIASDASFADDEATRRSSQGYIFMLFGGPILWKAGRQATVTTSTTEAELLALEQTAKETLALARLFHSISLDLGKLMEIFCDNQQTIRLVVGANERISTKLRHVDIQNMWLRQEYAAGKFVVTYLATDEMPADGLTKNLSRQKFEHFRELLNLQDTQAIVAPSS